MQDEYEPDGFFADAEEREAETFHWGARKTLVNGALMHGAKQTMAIVIILPGEEEPYHLHPNAEQLLHVLSGQGEILIGDTMYHLTTGDTVRIPAEVPHQGSNPGWEPWRVLVVQSTGRIETVILDSETGEPLKA